MNIYRILIEVLDAIGVALTVLVADYTISSVQWEATIDFLEKRSSELLSKLDAANTEITSLKVQLSQAISF